MVKRLPAMRETRFNPWVGRSPEEGNGNPLQYSCLQNSMDRGACWATVHGVAKTWLQLSERAHKQEMARWNIDILRISELKWMEMGEFNSNDHYICYCGQESLRRNGVATIVNKKSPKCSSWMESQKRQNDLCSFPRQTIQYHSNPSLSQPVTLKLKLNGSMKTYRTCKNQHPKKMSLSL